MFIRCYMGITLNGGRVEKITKYCYGTILNQSVMCCVFELLKVQKAVFYWMKSLKASKKKKRLIKNPEKWFKKLRNKSSNEKLRGKELSLSIQLSQNDMRACMHATGQTYSDLSLLHEAQIDGILFFQGELQNCQATGNTKLEIRYCCISLRTNGRLWGLAVWSYNKFCFKSDLYPVNFR